MVFLYVAVAILGLAATLFAVQNPDPVSVRFLAWRSIALPLSLVILLSAAVGMILTAVSGFAQQRTLRRRIRLLETRLARLPPPGEPVRRARETARWQFAQPDGPAPVPAASPPAGPRPPA